MSRGRPGSPRELRVAVLTPYYLPGFRGGGPIRSIAAMVAQHGARIRFGILTSDRDWGEDEPLPVPVDAWTPVGGAQVRYLSPRRRPLRLLLQLRRLRPDVLYLNGLFPAVWSILPNAAAATGVVRARHVLIAPRGELGQGALALKAGKKSLFLRVARGLGLYRRVSWHASTPAEAREIEAVFPGARVLVHANETLLPALALRASAGTTREGDPSRGIAPATTGEVGPLRVVFASRVTPKKGLDVLLRALPLVDRPVVVDIYGQADPSDAAYLQECERLADRAHAAGVGHRVTFRGAVPPEHLLAAFAAHDVLALPTANENFGHVIPEALSAGCPVLLPDTTPWTAAIAQHAAGAIVDSREPADWAAHLCRWAALDPNARVTAREAAADAYDAWAAGRSTRSVFDQLPASN